MVVGVTKKRKNTIRSLEVFYYRFVHTLICIFGNHDVYKRHDGIVVFREDELTDAQNNNN